MDRPGVRKSQRAVENREKWGKLVVRSSVVPKRPSRYDDDDETDELETVGRYNSFLKDREGERI